MGVPSSNESESIDQEQQMEMINKTGNNQNIILICFDPNNETVDLNKRLHQINDNIVFHTDLQSCITFIRSTEKQKIFLIISSSQILSDIINLHQIHFIFVFCLNIDQCKHALLENPKIIGIYDNIDLLSSSIQEQINLVQKQLYKWCLFNQNEYENKDLSKQDSDFLWLQLFHDVLLHLPHNEHAKKQMMDACRYYYRDNLEQLKFLDEFEQKYDSKEALRWFVKSSFLRKMINTALRTKDIDLLYTLRYFLADLIENLAHEHQQIIQSNDENFIVYREMKLSSDEFNQFEDNKGRLTSMKGFQIATTDRSSAFTLSPSSLEQADLISVLFEIECNIKELGDSFSFTDISHLTESPSYQKTFLFDFNATFRLETIQQEEQMWVIKLNAVSDGRTVLRKYIDDTHRQIGDISCIGGT